MALPMVPVPGYPSRDDACPGMAHFAGTGPDGKTCGDCRLRGVWRDRQKYSDDRGRWEDVRSYNGSCSMFKKLTGKFGPVVQKAWRACRYFEQKDKGFL